MLHYNENKVTGGEATLIMASGFAGEIDSMNFNQKLNRFTHLQELKPDVKTNAVHISLNFHSSEQLKDELLQEIAAEYMERIGFGDQPFLVYRHDDAAHLHMHIVTTNITASGERIDLHDIGKKLSEPARKAIENEFNLVKAESKLFKAQSGIRPADLEQAKYGRLPTKRAINNVITAVARDYKFSSLAEFNAVLKGFNVVALRGEKHTAMFEKKGLIYALLDEKGVPVGVPIKASSFYSKPTLRNLEKKFEQNALKRKPFKEGLKNRVDKVLLGYSSITRLRFEQELKSQGIDVLFRQNESGQVFGITFVDHNSKTVFNGSDLGKAYSAKSITEKFGQVNRPVKTEKAESVCSLKHKQTHHYITKITNSQSSSTGNLLEALLEKSQPEYGTGIPRKRKKRKKRGQTSTQELSI
ncbi:Relaxase/Mobilization nuclease domain protein [compost metagenome]